jgi:hypothetical protein
MNIKFLTVEITIRRGLKEKGEKWRVCINSGYNTFIHGNVIMKLCITILNKNVFCSKMNEGR